jgi:mercuric ion binding protein
MKRILVITAGVLALSAGGILSTMAITSLAAPSAAAQVTAARTVSFSIENMTCALCPVTVKSAMAGVNGVKSVEINFDAKTATVVFDPSVTTLEAIAAASTNAGYPATAKG